MAMSSNLIPFTTSIRAAIDICQHYNNSKIFDVFGFGAKVPPQNFVSPIFSLTLNDNPSVVGVSGVMQAYRNSLNRVQLFGPTNFSPIINEVAKKAAKIANNGSRYQILLILTDGIINDMAKTKQAIISASFFQLNFALIASSLPLSIIIIGVGNDPFESMVELDSDSDDHLLTHEGRTAQRDIVQFVPLRNFLSMNGQNVDSEHAMALLAKEVLAEIPLQLTSFMKSWNIEPRPPNDPWPRDQEAQLPSQPIYPPQPQQPSQSYPEGQPAYSSAMPYPTHPMQPAGVSSYQPYGQQPQYPDYPPQNVHPGQNQPGGMPPAASPPYQQFQQMSLPTNSPPSYPSAPPPNF
ncbi:hypothetical protein WR25_06983 [Diploscapter pachys]|uniref:Copine C-terminal domain-containing protein n=1 Tax=Diploscapter pachys TaxID=2018661 RepID=A0A2A2L801_9BILA|nr:hypothetical protein WR25_06983 [Diploscapter pachys]